MSGTNQESSNTGTGQETLPPKEPTEERSKVFERDEKPSLPTSGQILGALVKRMGLNGNALDTKTAQRYFSGKRVKDTSREKVLGGAAKAFMEFGLIPKFPSDSKVDVSLRLAESTLRWHAAMWDSIRSYLRSRMTPVQPSHLGLVWTAYLRLATIDIALRVAAALRSAGAAPETLQTLDWLDRTRRGQFLNQLRLARGLSLEQLAEQVGVSNNTVDAWTYHGARPSDQNLVALAKALVLHGNSSQQVHLLAELRRFFWASDLLELLNEHLDPEVVEALFGRFRSYTELAFAVIDRVKLHQAESEDIIALAFLGSSAPIGGVLLAELATQETDEEWRKDLTVASGDWTPRVLTTIYKIGQEEVAAIDKATSGRLLENWSVSSPEAYRHYQRSMELQYEGRIDEAVREVAKAKEIDPLDPVPHLTLGSMLGGLGNMYRDAEMVKEGLNECRLAATLAPGWILPWAEIGYILVGAGRPRDAVTHLLSVPEDCVPLDTRYYMAVALAHQALGNFQESLEAFEKALRLDPENLQLVTGAVVASVLQGDKSKVSRYLKEAQHLGKADLTRENLQQTARSVFELVRHPEPPLL